LVDRLAKGHGGIEGNELVDRLTIGQGGIGGEYLGDRLQKPLGRGGVRGGCEGEETGKGTWGDRGE